MCASKLRKLVWILHTKLHLILTKMLEHRKFVADCCSLAATSKKSSFRVDIELEHQCNCGFITSPSRTTSSSTTQDFISDRVRTWFNSGRSSWRMQSSLSSFGVWFKIIYMRYTIKYLRRRIHMNPFESKYVSYRPVVGIFIQIFSGFSHLLLPNHNSFIPIFPFCSEDKAVFTLHITEKRS